ncbi:DNA-binding protein [Siculibacillus lacustris]|uniref:DNA-binding protein n=1 Tax=Siculibacillus lacustris TaxID=1549641 RepID=A0A4Q9VZ14_9HYPH|nr:helix-turn-helix domain-containing protein [Siculibacillus lacustris]TBW40811.1 DNA-binding protein [Siculibacillus lacustris]
MTAQLLQLLQAAQALNTSRSTLEKLIREGDVRTVKLGRRTMIPAAEIDRIAAGKPRDDVAAAFV